MARARSIPQLLGRLLRRSRGQLLGWPVTAIAAELDDPISTDALLETARAHKVETLRELLLEPGLEQKMQREVGEVRTRRLIEGLDDWSRGATTAPTPADRSAPESVGIARPPRSIEGLRAWAESHGVAGVFDEPASAVKPWLSASLLPSSFSDAATMTVSDLLSRSRRPPLLRELGGSEGAILSAVRSLLSYRATRQVMAERRRKTWTRAPASPQLRLLSSRLRDHLARVVAMPNTGAPVLYEEAALEIEPSEPTVMLRFRTLRPIYAFDQVARLHLPGFETGPIRSSCDCVEGADGLCRHVRVLLEWTLDSIHNPTDPLSTRLEDATAAPTWTRVLEKLEAVQEPRGTADERDQQRLVWRVGIDDGELAIAPAVCKRLKNGRWSRGRLTALRALETSLLDRVDRRVYAHLLFADSALSHLKSEEGLMLALEELVGHPRVYAAAKPDQALSLRRCRPSLSLVEAVDGLRVEGHLGGRAFNPDAPSMLLLGDRCAVELDLEAKQMLVARVDPALLELLNTIRHFPTSFPPETHERLLRILMPLQSEADLSVPPKLRGARVVADAEPILRLTPLESVGLEAELVVRPLPESEALPVGGGPQWVFGQRPDGARISARRDLSGERERARELVQRLALPDEHRRDDGRWVLDETETALELLTRARELDDELRTEWPTEQRWHLTKATLGDLRVRIKAQGDWFGVNGEVELDGEKVPLRVLLESTKQGRRYVRLGSGRFARLEEQLVEKLHQADKVIHQRGQRELTLGTAGAEALNEALGDAGDLSSDAAFHDLLGRIKAASQLEPEVPQELKAELRDYQRQGYRWLARLSAWNGGGCLADDMGLGKTVQALAVLLTRRERGPALVVAPTSVGAVWMEQTTRFAPDLRPRLYRGPNREALRSELRPGDLLITSYDILALDIDTLCEHEFDTLVLDEAQAIKNARTKRAKAARRVRASFRLALTGTPLENHLGELWSLFAAVNPGLLGPWDRFRDRWAVAIEKHGDEERRSELARLIQPFVLRRTKGQVAPELPSRTEVVHPVELSDKERRAYETARREILESLASRGGAEEQHRFVVLAGITRLRRLACHPRLIDSGSTLPASKMAAATDLIEQAVANNERALVFSQFTGYLALLREELDRRRIPYLYLDGSTAVTKRNKLVTRWAEAREPLFLISLKAGGTGLNLTGADVVLHLDPWWNPAVEDQATDRTHRIGQTRPVTVIRLIAQGTIEEAVVELHNQKRELARSLLEGTETAAQLNTEELVELICRKAP